MSEAERLILHGYFRSSASWRVRIALALKGLQYRQVAHHLRRGEQRDPGYLRLNPQGLVPALDLDGEFILTQSLAICEYLDETWPAPPLLPPSPLERARVRSFSQIIASDIHPVQNLKVLERLRGLGVSEPDITAWARDVITDGLAACAFLVEGRTDPFCFGAAPGLADICLVPQLANARRFGVERISSHLLEVERRCLAHPAFAETAPDVQPDAE